MSIKFHFSRIVTQGEIPSDKRSVPNTHCCTLRRRELSMQCYTHQQISFTHRLLCTSRLFAFKFPRTICDGGCIASLKLFLHAICGSLGERVEVCMVSIPCQEHDYVCFLRPWLVLLSQLFSIHSEEDPTSMWTSDTFPMSRVKRLGHQGSRDGSLTSFFFGFNSFHAQGQSYDWHISRSHLSHHCKYEILLIHIVT